jgi:hypothetical protein
MPTSISVDSVTTEDAAPGAAPHRISDKAGWTTLTVAFTPTHDGALVPSDDLLPSDGSAFPGEVWPDDGTYPDQGAVLPGVARDVIGWEVRLGGSDAASGRLVERAGTRVSPSRLAGTRTRIGPAVSTPGVRSASGTQITATFDYVDANDGGGDGARTVNVYVLTESQGWS